LIRGGFNLDVGPRTELVAERRREKSTIRWSLDCGQEHSPWPTAEETLNSKTLDHSNRIKEFKWKNRFKRECH